MRPESRENTATKVSWKTNDVKGNPPPTDRRNIERNKKKKKAKKTPTNQTHKTYKPPQTKTEERGTRKRVLKLVFN